MGHSLNAYYHTPQHPPLLKNNKKGGDSKHHYTPTSDQSGTHQIFIRILLWTGIIEFTPGDQK